MKWRSDRGNGASSQAHTPYGFILYLVKTVDNWLSHVKLGPGPKTEQRNLELPSLLFSVGPLETPSLCADSPLLSPCQPHTLYSQEMHRTSQHEHVYRSVRVCAYRTRDVCWGGHGGRSVRTSISHWQLAAETREALSRPAQSPRSISCGPGPWAVCRPCDPRADRSRRVGFDSAFAPPPTYHVSWPHIDAQHPPPHVTAQTRTHPRRASRAGSAGIAGCPHP